MLTGTWAQRNQNMTSKKIIKNDEKLIDGFNFYRNFVVTFLIIHCLHESMYAAGIFLFACHELLKSPNLGWKRP